jgi:hypothetical protein
MNQSIVTPGQKENEHEATFYSSNGGGVLLVSGAERTRGKYHDRSSRDQYERLGGACGDTGV